MERLFIDVRQPNEYHSGHVEGAINLPPETLMANPAELEDISKDTNIVLYCRSGARSESAVHILKAKGFTNIVNGINKEHVEHTYFRS